MEPLAFSKANRQKGKVVIIAKKEVIVRKAQPKWKIKYLCYSKTPAKLIKVLNSKKELKDSIFSILH